MARFKYVRNSWYVAGFSHEFGKGKLQGHEIARAPVVIWRTDSGRVVAFDNRCVHKRMPLSEGKLLEDGSLQCAYHGMCFNDQGRCVAIPSQPDGAIPARARLKAFPVIEQDGLVWIWPGEAEKADKVRPPRTPEITDDSWESIGSEPMRIAANYLLLIENLLDISHFYPLHDGNIGDLANSRIPVELIEGEQDGNRFVKTIREVRDYKQPPFLADWFVYDIVDRHHSHCLTSPGLTRVEMRVAPPGKLGGDADRGYILFHTHTPIDEKSHVWRWCVNCKADHMSKGDPSKSAAKRVAEMFPAVVEEDRWALEKQQEMFAYPDENYTELYLKPDKAARLARRLLLSLQRQDLEPARAPVAAD
jgi:vanillate O-demethylase monooxygenase subunit